MHMIRLTSGEWQFDETDRLGPSGGFGDVFRGSGPIGDVAVKRLKVTAIQAAHRELNISERLMSRDLKHVVPVLDAGQDAESDRYFIVMPVCEKSLQDDLNSKGQLGPEIAIEIAQCVLAGLNEVGDITHRDLKPGNILLHDGAWKIADFGIAKFIEDSTSLESLRNSRTPPYAAPEQWRGERPTSATDVYALGCIMHTVVNGSPPFVGDADALREQHLHELPEAIGSFPPRVATFVTHMLRKAPAARPTINRCVQVFSSMQLETKDLPISRKALLEAADHVARTEAEAEAEQARAQTRQNERQALFEDASNALKSVKENLFREIASVTESVSVDKQAQLTFGSARLQMDAKAHMVPDYRTSENLFNWVILAWSTISITCQSNGGSYTWSATLLYADRNDDNGYRWYEIAFWSLGSEFQLNEPFAIGGNDQNLFLALGRGTHSLQIAYGPLAIDSEDEEDFVERWIALTARAARGQLERPNGMPVNLSGFLR